MLKIIRELAVENPWVLKIIMGVIAVTFVITMGWWGIKMPGQDVVASVNGHPIKVKEYRRAYNRAVEYYRDMYKDKFSPELLEQMKVRDKVLEDLVGRELWLEKAQELGLMVSDEELRESIMKMKVFHREGRFDRTLYERILTSNRMNVSDFERAQRIELLIDKMKRIVKDSVFVTDAEVNEAFPLTLSGDKDRGKVTARPAEEMERLKKFLRFQKQEQAIAAYTDAMRAAAKIKVNKDLL